MENGDTERELSNGSSGGASSDHAAGSSASHAPGSSSNQHVTSAQELHFPPGSSPMPPSMKAIEEALRARADALREVQGCKPLATPAAPLASPSNGQQVPGQAPLQAPTPTLTTRQTDLGLASSKRGAGTPFEATWGQQQPSQQVAGSSQMQLGPLGDQQLLQQLAARANGQQPSPGALLLQSGGLLQQDHLPFLVELEARRLQEQQMQQQQQSQQHQQQPPPQPSQQQQQQPMENRGVLGSRQPSSEQLSSHFSHAFSQAGPAFQSMAGPVGFSPFSHFGSPGHLQLQQMAGQQAQQQQQQQQQQAFQQAQQQQQQLPLQLLQSLPPQLRQAAPGLNGWPQPMLPQLFPGQQPLLPMPVRSMPHLPVLPSKSLPSTQHLSLSPSFCPDCACFASMCYGAVLSPASNLSARTTWLS